MYNFTFGGNHQFNKLVATWNLTTAKASEERPNERYVSFRQSRQAVTVDVSDPFKPFAYLADWNQNLNIGFNELTENYNYTEDKDLNGRLDFTLPYAKQSF
jgi:hypothetical protein